MSSEPAREERTRVCFTKKFCETMKMHCLLSLSLGLPLPPSLMPLFSCFVALPQTRMQSLNPDPKAQYTSIYGALKKIICTEGFWRPLRGLNVMVMGAGPAHAMYFACYEKMKRTLNAVFHHHGNSHIANGI